MDSITDGRGVEWSGVWSGVEWSGVGIRSTMHISEMELSEIYLNGLDVRRYGEFNAYMRASWFVAFIILSIPY